MHLVSTILWCATFTQEPTTPPEAVLRWLQPSQSADWAGGETRQLQWTSLNGEVPPASVTLSYSLDQGPWILISKGLDPAGFYFWTVPWHTTSSLLIRVAAKTYSGVFVESLSETMTVKAKLRPNIAQARRHADKARIYLARAEVALAIDELEQALVHWPEFPEALNDLGTAYARERQYAKALGYYGRARQSSPSSPTPYVNGASMEYHLGLYRDALADLSDAVELGVNHDARLALQTAEQLGKLIDYFLESKEADPAAEASRCLLRIPTAKKETRARAQEVLDRSHTP